MKADALDESSKATRTVLDHLREQFPAAKMLTLRRMIAAKRVRINGKPARSLKQEITTGATVLVSDTGVESARATLPPAAKLNPLKVIHEDADVLVVFKPADLLTSTVPGEKRATALAIVREYLSATDPNARLGLIHRLDRDAAGLLVFSKNAEAYESLKSQFFHHTVDREYEAIVRGRVKPRAGRIESRLVERADGSVHSTKQEEAGQQAITEYSVIETMPQGGKTTTRVRVKLHTGRKHQIRVHLSEKGWPILGDRMYGGGTGQLQLTAALLAFEHPRTKQRVVFKLNQ